MRIVVPRWSAGESIACPKPKQFISIILTNPDKVRTVRRGFQNFKLRRHFHIFVKPLTEFWVEIISHSIRRVISSIVSAGAIKLVLYRLLKVRRFGGRTALRRIPHGIQGWSSDTDKRELNRL